ncbi:MAG: transposase [Anaerolineae bacterium]|nr:transposase [Anaerolineae bacterium]
MPRVNAARAVRSELLHNRTVGIDVDRDLLVTCFYDRDSPEHPVEEFPNTLVGFKALVHRSALFDPGLIILESTGQYHLAAYDAMRLASLPVAVINPATVKALLRVEGKSDRKDAFTLARIASSFHLRRSNIPDQEQRRWRMYFKVYDDGYQAKRRSLNRLNAALTMAGCPIMKAVTGKARMDIVRRIGLMSPFDAVSCHPQQKRHGMLAEMIPEDLPDYVMIYRDALMAQADLSQKQMDDARSRLESIADTDEVRTHMNWMLTVPWTSPWLALRVLAEMGSDFTSRYDTPARFCSAMGCAPSSEVSGGKVLKVTATYGRVRLLTAHVQTLKGAVMHFKPGPLQLWYSQYRGRAGYSKSLLALSHLLAEGWWVCTKMQTPWDEFKACGGRVSGYRHVDRETGEITVRY